MTQFARPSSDVATGTWTTAPLFNKVDEVAANDGDFIQSANSPNFDICELGLSSITDPEGNTGHVVRYRYQKSAAAGRQIDLVVRLLDGATEIASYTHTDIGNGWVQADQTLSGAEADAIGNYGDLRLEFNADAVGGGAGRNGQVSWAVMETPDAPEVDFGWFVQLADVTWLPHQVRVGTFVGSLEPITPDFGWFKQQPEPLPLPTAPEGVFVVEPPVAEPELEPVAEGSIVVAFSTDVIYAPGRMVGY